MLFALSLPHSIAAADISLGLSILFWLIRDIAAQHLRFARTPVDWPLLGFAVLTVLSALFSVAPGVSLPKLKSLIVFAVIYLVATNLSQRGARLLLGLVLVSGLVGVSWSLLEKIIGRGMIVTAINADSPLAGSRLQTGDVIWLVGRVRVSTLTEVTEILREHPVGEKVTIEALHNGDPLPVELIVTEELKQSANPLRVNVSGSSRRFRVSGFSRHFITYADQMQLLALLCFGVIMGLLRDAARQRLRLAGALIAFILFATALVLTASRAAIAAFFLAMLLIAVLAGGKRIALAALALTIVMSGLAYYTLISTRVTTTGSFLDDSTRRRIGYMQAGLQLIPRHPLLGTGMEAHKQHWQEWGFPGDYITHTHSTLIQIAMERGLPALGCFIWLLGTMFISSWRACKQAMAGGARQEAGWLLGACGGLAGFSAGTLVNYNFGDSEVIMLLLFIWTLAFVVGGRDDL